MVTLGEISAILQKKYNFNFVTSCPVQKASYEKWVHLKRKEFAPNGSKFIPLKVDTLFKWGDKQFDGIAVTESALPFRAMGNTSKGVSFDKETICLLSHWLLHIQKVDTTF